MVRHAGILLMGGASGACGFAALGLALYANSPAQIAVTTLFAGVGFGAGLLCGGLHGVFDSLPAAAPSGCAGAGRPDRAGSAVGTVPDAFGDISPSSA